MGKNYALIALAVATLVLYFSNDKLGKENEKLKAYISERREKEAVSTAEIEVVATKKEATYKEANIDATTVYNAKKETENADLRRNLDDARRLLNSSEARSNLYRKAAEAGELANAAFAARLAEMDASLSEGRVVVAELKGALGERDRELTLAMSEIAALRKAFDREK